MSGKAVVRGRAVLTAALAALAVGALGGSVTDLGPWYAALEKPSWQPPDLAFPIVWTLIYALTAAAGVLAWRATPDRRGRDWLIGLFALNGFLNVLWSLLFFRVQRPDWALMEVALLFLSILAMIVFVWPRSKLGSCLLAPYVLWIGFAAALNGAVVLLNRPFGS